MDTTSVVQPDDTCDDVDISDIPAVILNSGTSGTTIMDASSYPCTPPPSRMDPSLTTNAEGPEGLPSFNNSEMLRRIQVSLNA